MLPEEKSGTPGGKGEISAAVAVVAISPATAAKPLNRRIVREMVMRSVSRESGSSLSELGAATMTHTPLPKSAGEVTLLAVTAPSRIRSAHTPARSWRISPLRPLPVLLQGQADD